MAYKLPAVPTYSDVGKRWREVQGEKDWQGLLEPLDLTLRSELIRYGDFADAAYDGFDHDERSPFCGSYKFSMQRFFDQVGLPNSGYEVTDYIFATAGKDIPKSFFSLIDREISRNGHNKAVWNLETNFAGYIAVATDEQEIQRLGRRDILIVWRGTKRASEWKTDMLDRLVPSGLDPRREGQSGSTNLKVELGFLNLYTASNPESQHTTLSARRQVLLAVKRLLEKYGDEKELSITIVGHSMGGALAILCGYDIAESSVNQPDHLPESFPKWRESGVRQNPDDVVELTESDHVRTVPVTVITYAGPRVGNNAFRDRLEQLQVKVLRVVNIRDIAPKVPGIFVNESSKWLECLMQPIRSFIDDRPQTYTHVGQCLEIDSFASPYLQKDRNYLHFHDLQGSYLHILSGFQGISRPFKQVLTRDIALANKGSDYLDPKLFIPAKWFQQQNKGLHRIQQDPRGQWVTFPRVHDDIPKEATSDSNRDWNRGYTTAGYSVV